MDMATQARVERGVNQKVAEGSARLEFGLQLVIGCGSRLAFMGVSFGVVLPSR